MALVKKGQMKQFLQLEEKQVRGKAETQRSGCLEGKEQKVRRRLFKVQQQNFINIKYQEAPLTTCGNSTFSQINGPGCTDQMNPLSAVDDKKKTKKNKQNNDPHTDTFPVFGIKGEGNESTVPGSRVGASSWSDLDGRTLWLFGGYGFAEDQFAGSFFFFVVVVERY
jgi:hypothetical protein